MTTTMTISAPKSLETIVMEATSEYLAEIAGKKLSAAAIRDGLIARTALQIQMENTQRPKNEKLPVFYALKPAQIVEVLMARHHIVNLNLNGMDTGDVRTNTDAAALAVYQEKGAFEGVYVASDSQLRNLAAKLGPFLSAAQHKDVLHTIADAAPMRSPQSEPYLVAVNNGIFNTRTKELLPFSPDMVFTAKSRVNYVEGAPLPVITMPDGEPWDVVSWVDGLSDDEGVPELLWEIMSAIVRPNVRWNQAAFFYSEAGNNGKGSLCALMRGLAGVGSVASISIEDFGKDFMLTPLVNASSVVVDENNVGILLDKAAAFKAAVTGDVLLVNRKSMDPIALRFNGMIVQCINEFFKSRDKSGSFARRQLFVPFEKSYTGVERTYIKEDYLRRQDVLEYVLWRVLQMDHTKLSVPPVCEALALQYEQHNDPVKAFWAEFEDQFVWDLLPFNFLYDLYKAWMARENPGGMPVSGYKFSQSVRGIAVRTGRWDAGKDAQTKHRSANKMDITEPLILEYDLVKWMNPMAPGYMSHHKASFRILSHYRGLKRL